MQLMQTGSSMVEEAPSCLHVWSRIQRHARSRGAVEGHANSLFYSYLNEGRTLFCYAQYFLDINDGTARRHIYHNIPALAWEPVMQIATGRLRVRLRSVTTHWHGRQRSHSSCCPCCRGVTENPAHYVFEWPSILSADLADQCTIMCISARRRRQWQVERM